MKFALAYYFLLLYATVIIKPVIPVVEDGISHCFGEAYHIATVHEKYGNDHVEKEIENTNDDSNNNAKNTLKTEDVVVAHEVTKVQTFTPLLFDVFLLHYSNCNACLQKIIINKIIPPPKFSC